MMRTPSSTPKEIARLLKELAKKIEKDARLASASTTIYHRDPDNPEIDTIDINLLVIWKPKKVRRKG